MDKIKKTIWRYSHGLRTRCYGNFDGNTVIVALHQEKALYFAVPKVASTSIEYLLTEVIRKRLPPSILPLMDDGTHYFKGKEKRHEMRYRRILLSKHQVSKYSDYYGFAFVRNPWDRLVSCYRDKVEGKIIGPDTNPKGAQSIMVGREIAGETATFEEFVKVICSVPDEKSNRHYRSQYMFLTDKHGKLMPKDIFYFENLTEDFNKVCRKIGLDELQMPHRNATKKKSFRDYYTPELVDMVSERYARDIEL
ncbi:MAG: sulfotransferase family protein, partial [Spirochaetales bacterium]|nr:sulfotransferase family protein [Spirochaetales bacterium]